jgi:hypothetical protein
MYAAGPVGKRRNKESGQQHLDYFSGEYIVEHTVYGNRPQESNKGIKNHIDVIIAKAEDIKDRKYFDKQVALQIIPPRIGRIEKATVFVFISTPEKIGEITIRIIK